MIELMFSPKSSTRFKTDSSMKDFASPGQTARFAGLGVRGFPQKDSNGKITRVGGTALDVTALKHAEDQVQANLAKANSAWAEAEALRKATLALTEDLHMDSVLDTLVRSLAELVPYTCAWVLNPLALL